MADWWRQHETTRTASAAGRCTAIYYPFRTNNRWAGPGDTVARSQPRWQKGGDPMGPGQQLERCQENWKGGVREMGRKRKKAPSEMPGWSITCIHPSLFFFFCQFFKEPKETWWLNRSYKNACREGTISMPHLFRHHRQYSCMLWLISCDFECFIGCFVTSRPDISEKCTLSGKLWEVLIRLNWLPAWSTLWIHSSGIYHAVAWHHSVHCSQEKLLNQTPRDRRTTPQNSRPKWRI